MKQGGILRGTHSDRLEPWIDAAVETGLVPIVRLAPVIHRDIAAVRKAIERPWSVVQAEGQINRPKTLKRPIYSLAGTEQPKARMLPLRTQ